MIVSRTPLRVSFVGGGTDLPEFYERYGGAVVSTAVDKWIRVIVARRFEGDVRVSYSQTEIVECADLVQHELVREALRCTGLRRGLDVVTLADVPSRGTGLGSSSAVTVGLLNALYAFQGIYKSPLELAEEAANLEIGLLGKPIGRQDHYAAALGGLNLIEFLPRDGVRVQPLICAHETLQHVHRSLLLFFTGRQRSAESVLREQSAATRNGKAVHALTRMRDLAYELHGRLTAGEHQAFGPLLHRNWELKRSLVNGLSDPEIDNWYADALAAGATGGKLLGAGAGGFLLVVTPQDKQARVRSVLSNLREVPFRFVGRGTEISFLERPAYNER